MTATFSMEEQAKIFNTKRLDNLKKAREALRMKRVVENNIIQQQQQQQQKESTNLTTPEPTPQQITIPPKKSDFSIITLPQSTRNPQFTTQKTQRVEREEEDESAEEIQQRNERIKRRRTTNQSENDDFSGSNTDNTFSYTKSFFMFAMSAISLSLPILVPNLVALYFPAVDSTTNTEKNKGSVEQLDRKDLERSSGGRFNASSIFMV